MIDIIQWRASIGAFCNAHQSRKSVTTILSDPCYFVTFSDMYCQYAIIWFVLVYCVVNIYYHALCLVLSGDIETNPEPVYKVCPECDSRIHIRGETIYRNIAILQYLLLQYNTIWPIENIDILHVAIYYNILLDIVLFVAD